MEEAEVRFRGSDGCDFEQVQLHSFSDVLNLARTFKGVVVLMGHGSKGQIGDVPGTLATVDRVIADADKKYGKGQWLAVFGGDPLSTGKPDVAVVAQHVQRRGAPLLALQSDKVAEWGGVDAHIDFVHYVPTTLVEEKDAEGKATSRIVWGGFLNGKPLIN